MCCETSLGGHFRALDQTCEDVFSCEDFSRVLRKCTCLFVSSRNSIKTCMCVHVCVCVCVCVFVISNCCELFADKHEYCNDRSIVM